MTRIPEWAGITACLLLLGLAGAYPDPPGDTTDRRSLRPAPTETSERLRHGGLSGQDRARLRGERKDLKAGRKAWIETLHKAGPGLPWRERDARSWAVIQAERLDQLRRRGPAALAEPIVMQRPFRDGSREVVGEWLERGSSNQAGRMHCACVADSTIWAGSSGGTVWRGRLDGSGWQPLNDWMAMPDIVSLGRRPARDGRPARLWVAHGGSALFHTSDDEGQLWLPADGLDSPEDWGWTIRAEALDSASDSLLLLAAEWDYIEWTSRAGLYLSADGGETFARAFEAPAQPQLCDLWLNGDGTGGFLLANLQCYALAPDGSATLLGSLPQNHDPNLVGRTHLRGRVTPDGIELFAALSLGSTSVVYRSGNGGQDWALAGTAPTSTFMQNSFGLSAQADGPLFIGGVDAYRSGDEGSSWQAVNLWWQYYDDPANKLHADIPGLQALPAPAGSGLEEIVLVSTDGGLYLSTDGLQTVQNLSLQGLRISQYYGSYSHRQFPDIVYAGAQDQGYQRSIGDEGGLIAFDQLISGDYAHLVSGDGGNSLWCVYPGFLMHYPEATASEQILTWDFTTSNHYWLPPLMADPLDPAVVWLAGGGVSGGTHLQRIQRVGNGLQHSEHPFNFGGSALSALAASPQDPQRRYAMCGDGRFFRSADGGDSWTLSPGFSGPDAHYFHGNDIAVSPTEPGRLWICGSGYDNPPVYTSADHGATFTALSQGLPSTLVYALAVSDDGQWLFAASELGPYVWDPLEQAWQSIAGLAAPDQVYWNVEWIESLHTARFVTYGRGIWDFVLTGSTSLDDGLALRPAEFQLGAAPNPFNPATRITWQLAQAGPVRLALYDLQGRLLRVLHDGPLAAGSHVRVFDGSGLASGSYLLNLVTPAGRQSARITLLK